VLSWTLLAVLGIIWAAFLLPSWRRSPTSSVEAFEEKMNLLAEANSAQPGRWVLVPQKGRRFLGPQDRQRMRLRRRRRLVFMTLLEAIGFTLVIGLFPPLRTMLYATGLLVVALIAYVVVLLRVRQEESARARDRQAYAAAYRRQVYGNGNGNGLDGPVSAAAGNGKGHSSLAVDELFWSGSGLHIVDEDVHVVIRRSDEIDLEAVRAQASRLP